MAVATNITDVARLVKQLKIDGFCTIDQHHPWATIDDCIRSRWAVGGYEWEICVYPGRTASTGDSRRDDALTVECTITVLKESSVPTSPAKEMPVLSSSLHQNLGDLLQTEMGAAVTFLVSGESFAAHKNILAARSPVFKAQFFGEMKEKSSNDVEVEGMEAAVFKAMLHFIYTDTAPELEQGLEEAAVMAAMGQHLLVAADRYGLDRLKTICENKLSSGITVDAAATTLALAEQHNCSQLKASCVEFMVSTAEVLDVVLATEGYKDLAGSCSSVLADLLKSARGINN